MTGAALSAVTRPGEDLLALAGWLADEVAPRAADHDRDGSYPHESLELLRESGYLAAPVPEELGGLGVASVHDLVVASARLAQGDASLAIGVNMHWIAVHNMDRRRRSSLAAGNERRAAAFASSLETVARDGVVMAAAISEPQQDLLRPSTRAERTEDGGWRIRGRKVFCTMSPAATTLYAAVAYPNGDGTDHYGYAQIPAGTPGVIVHDDWDAMGMRASGSHTVTFDGAEVPAEALRGGHSIGALAPWLDRNLTAGLFHASASLGIAEAAHAAVVRVISGRGGPAPGDGRSRMVAAESTMDLAAARAILARAATMVDDHDERHPDPDAAEQPLLEAFGETQAAKTFVNEAAVRVVDRALALSGGAGYRSASPLSRAYRDVRAGAFMHPLGANRAYDVLGRLAFGQDPGLG